MINLETVEQYCSEDITKIENYYIAVADQTQTWICHHKLEFQNGHENSKKFLITNNLYYYRPANELVFMTKSEHNRLHFCGKPKSDITRLKISASQKGKPKSATARANMSKARRKWTPTKEHMQKVHAAVKGKHWYNNGVIQLRANECPDGFVKGRLKSST